MKYQNVELHNIDGIVEDPDRNAVRIQRIPEELRLKVNQGAQERSLWPFSSEIRLAFEGDEASVTLSSDSAQDCIVYQGPFRAETLVIRDEPQTIGLRRADRVELMHEKDKKELPFSTDIFRLQFEDPEKPKAFRQILRDAVANSEHENLHLIEGSNNRRTGH